MAARICRRPYHVAGQRQIAPVVVGLGLFVAGNAIAYALRAKEAEARRRRGESPQTGGNFEDLVDGIYNRALDRDRSARGPGAGASAPSSRFGRPHPLWDPEADALGLDIGSGWMRVASLSGGAAKKEVLGVLEGLGGQRATPTCVHFPAGLAAAGASSTQDLVVGSVAKERRFGQNAQVVSDLQALLLAARGDGPVAPAIELPDGARVSAWLLKEGGSAGGSESGAFTLDSVVLGPKPARKPAGDPARNPAGPRASEVQSALVSDLLTGASARLGGGGGGGDGVGSRVAESVCVVAVPGGLPEELKGALVLNAMHAAHQHAQTEAREGARGGGGGDADGCLVLGSIDDAKAALLAALHQGLIGQVDGASAVLVVDVGARLTQATLFDLAANPAARGGGAGCEAAGEPTEPLSPPVAAAASARVGFDSVTWALADYLADFFLEQASERASVGAPSGAASGAASGSPLVSDPRLDPLALQRLFQAAEDAATGPLSTGTEAKVHLPFVGLSLATMQPEHLDATVTRGRLASVAEPALRAITAPIAKCLDAATAAAAAAASADDDAADAATAEPAADGAGWLGRVGCVLLVGGGARSTHVRAAVEAAVARALGVDQKERTAGRTSSGEATAQGTPPFRLVVPQAPEELTVLGAALAAKHGWVS